jgi:hypothetical protein
MSAENVAQLLADVLLPRGGLVVVLLQAYFDESIGHALVAEDGKKRKVPILCVAGYILEAQQAQLLNQEWVATLRQFDLPYFHMVDCAHGNPPFDKLNKRQRALVASNMIGTIKRRTIHGYASAVNVEHFKHIAPKSPLIGSAYSLCATTMLVAVQSLIGQRAGVDVAYFFEAGYDSQSEANRIMTQIFRVPQLRKASGYTSHTFVDKRLFPGVQAADLLAWHFYTDIRRGMEGKDTYRADFGSLRQHPHNLLYIEPELLSELSRMPDLGSDEANLLQIFLGTDSAIKILKLPRNAWKKAKTFKALGLK